MATKAARPAAHTPDDRMTLTEHLAELRTRIIRSMLAVTVGAVAVFSLWDPWIVDFLRHPYRQACETHASWDCKGQFLLSNPLSGFLTRTRVAGWGGVVIALPVILWQIWRFVVPALHAKERRYAVPFILSSVLLFLFGGYIAWIVYPKSLEFLISYAGPGQTVTFTMDTYIRLLTLMILAFGTGFLFPVLLVFLQLVNVLTPRKLIGWWRQAIVFILVLAAVITPSGDLFSLFGLAIPMWIFYFAAIAVGAILTRKRRRAAAAAGLDE
jgi:sec-independent protein translocase protein TatC